MKKNMVLATLAATLTVIGFSSSAYADGHKGGHRNMPSFETLDANADGQVTQDEFTALARTRFDTADTNSDGLLSAEEMSAMSSQDMKKRHEKRLKKMMRKLDKNEDGQISFEEMQSMRKGKSAERMIERFDDNDDGQISAEEYAKMENKMQKRKGKNKEHGKDKD